MEKIVETLDKSFTKAGVEALLEEFSSVMDFDRVKRSATKKEMIDNFLHFWGLLDYPPIEVKFV